MSHSLILEATKKDIRSLLLPNKDGLILKGLQEEHQAVLGCAIPSRKLGFSSDLEFLKSIPDAVEIICLPDKINFLCKAVADPNVDHISKLVAKQRSNLAGYHKKTKHVLDRQKYFQSDSGIRNQASTTTSGINSWEGHYQFMPNKNVYGSIRGNSNRIRRMPSSSSRALMQTKKRVDTTFKKDCLTIAEKCPEGIEIADFEVMYLKHTNKNLNFRQFGFTTLLECLASIPDILQFRKKVNKNNEQRDMIFSPYYASQYDQSQGEEVRSPIPVMKLTRPCKESCNSSESSEAYDSCEQITNEDNSANHKASLIKQIENYTDEPEENIAIIKANLLKLIGMYPKGIELTNLGSTYELEFSSELNPLILGCTSLDEMCIGMNDIFLCERSKEYRNSWTVFPVPVKECITSSAFQYSKEELTLVTDNIRQLFERQDVDTLTKEGLLEVYLKIYKKALNLKKIGMSMDELLNFLVEKDIIELSSKAEDPFKVMTHKQEILISLKNSDGKANKTLANKTLSIARLQLKSLQDQLAGESIQVQELPERCGIDSTLEIIMGEIWSPTKFWILLKDYYEKLVELGREMTEFYGDRNTEHLMLTESHVVDGQTCAVREGEDEKGDWYRSIIVNILDTNTVTVIDIDYGQRRKVKVDTLRFLRRDFAALKAQAIPSKLANVIPINGNKTWGKRACQYFAEIATESKDEGLYAIVKGRYHGLCRKLSLLLYDTATNNLDNGIYINQELVNHGMADVDPNGEENEGYELQLSKQPINLTEEHSKKEPLRPLRLPQMATLRAVNASSGYGTGPPLSPNSNKGPSNLKKSWMSTFIPEVSTSQQPEAEANGIFNNQLSQKLLQNSDHFFSAVGKDSNCHSPKNLTINEGLKKGNNSSYLTSNGNEIITALSLPNGNLLHTINMKNCRYVVSAEISSLFPRWKNKDVLEQMLELKKITIPNLVFTPEKDQNLFQEFILAEVKGITTNDGSLVKRVVIYPLEYIPEMLSLFHGRHDTVVEELIQAIKSEIGNSES